MSIEANGASADHTNNFQTMSPEELSQETAGWSSNMWEKARLVVDKDLSQNGTAIELVDLVLAKQEFNGTLDEEYASTLRHYRLCLTMPKETLERVLTLAPQE